MGVALPDDALAEILRRLPPRSLATSRCVCKAWQAIVDGRRLLLPELLPHSVRGIFLMHNELRYPAFLAHPSMEPEIFDNLNFNRHADATDAYWGSSAIVLDHCNGLLLYEDMEGFHVVNPATQRHESLPPPPHPSFGSDHLVFDPTESLHYEVFFVPRAPETDAPSLEWPASTWVLCVFSSRTGQWEERAFVREDEAAGTLDKEMRRRKPLWQRCSVYWQGVLFVPCNASFTVMRISLSNNKYRVIKMPTDIRDSEYGVCLGRSKEGLCSASFHDWYKLRVWILDETCGAMEWVLKHHIDIHHSVSRLMWHCEEKEGPWKLQDANNDEDYDQENLQDVNCDEDDSNNALIKSKVEWDSDNDNIVDNESESVECFSGDITVLGFHPYKDVIFLNLSLQRAVAYHLSTSMVQDLGKVSPDYYGGHAAYIESSFPYTPCLMAELPENKQDSHVEG